MYHRFRLCLDVLFSVKVWHTLNPYQAPTHLAPWLCCHVATRLCSRCSHAYSLHPICPCESTHRLARLSAGKESNDWFTLTHVVPVSVSVRFALSNQMNGTPCRCLFAYWARRREVSANCPLSALSVRPALTAQGHCNNPMLLVKRLIVAIGKISRSLWALVYLSVCLSVCLTDFLGAGRRLRAVVGVVGVVGCGGCGGVFTCHCCPSGQLLDTVRCKLPSARPVAVCTYCAQGFVAIMTQWSCPLFRIHYGLWRWPQGNGV